MSETTDNCTHTCYKCNKKLENVYWWIGDKYICKECYDLWHKPIYSRLERDELHDKLLENQNQKAIECLKEVQGWIFSRFVFETEGMAILDFIDNKIKELEGKDDTTR